MTTAQLANNTFSYINSKRLRPKFDTLEFAGNFIASHTSNEKVVTSGNGIQLLTRSFINPPAAELAAEDHHNVRLHYNTADVRHLTRGQSYLLSGLVVGKRFHDMPFLECEMEGNATVSHLLPVDKGPIISGLGTITQISETLNIMGLREGLEFYVKHNVGAYTVFGEDFIIVKYILAHNPRSQSFARNLRVGQRGAFGAIMGEWCRSDGAIVAELSYHQNSH
ncbi:hypothetical protein MJO28_017131 [Puccinia striiformis f. sp. tritici]|nr:hypothetical protein MJO28_017131 [Puccinia striiformis f. sp. tritici]